MSLHKSYFAWHKQFYYISNMHLCVHHLSCYVWHCIGLLFYFPFRPRPGMPRPHVDVATTGMAWLVGGEKTMWVGQKLTISLSNWDFDCIFWLLNLMFLDKKKSVQPTNHLVSKMTKHQYKDSNISIWPTNQIELDRLTNKIHLFY